MRILPTSKEWLVLISRAAAFGAGLAVWLFCGHLATEASAQTVMIVPADLLLKREVVGWLWFPFSWLPSPVYINDIWSILQRLLIGFPYGVLIAMVILWLFRTSPPKKT